jgi:hypothetical protein
MSSKEACRELHTLFFLTLQLNLQFSLTVLYAFAYKTNIYHTIKMRRLKVDKKSTHSASGSKFEGVMFMFMWLFPVVLQIYSTRSLNLIMWISIFSLYNFKLMTCLASVLFQKTSGNLDLSPIFLTLSMCPIVRVESWGGKKNPHSSKPIFFFYICTCLHTSKFPLKEILYFSFDSI